MGHIRRRYFVRVTPESRVNCHLLLLLVIKCMTCMLASERDMDAYKFDNMDARPGYYKKTPIRHPVHLNGMIYRFYVKPNHEVAWKVNFLNGHGVVVRKDIK
jgi:hypothetical protein